MGLTVNAKGMKDTYDCGYITFSHFRKNLARTYNEKIGELYEKWMNEGLTEEECDYFNKNCTSGIICFLIHSDCDGKFTPKECNKIYDDIKDLKMDMMGHNYGLIKQPDGKMEMESYNMLERWKSMFKYCYKNRVNMYFQ